MILTIQYLLLASHLLPQTGEFVKISTAVREVEAQLAQSRPDLAAMVRSLQELEKQNQHAAQSLRETLSWAGN